MKLSNNSQEGNIFLPDQDQANFSKLLATQLNGIQQISLDKYENKKECQNFEKLHDIYLKPKGFDLCVFNDQDNSPTFNSRLNNILQIE